MTMIIRHRKVLTPRLRPKISYQNKMQTNHWKFPMMMMMIVIVWQIDKYQWIIMIMNTRRQHWCQYEHSSNRYQHHHHLHVIGNHQNGIQHRNVRDVTAAVAAVAKKQNPCESWNNKENIKQKTACSFITRFFGQFCYFQTFVKITLDTEKTRITQLSWSTTNHKVCRPQKVSLSFENPLISFKKPRSKFSQISDVNYILNCKEKFSLWWALKRLLFIYCIYLTTLVIYCSRVDLH